MAEYKTNASSNIVEVGTAEAGQKLLRFLQRRLELPEPILQRWLRTGQIRLNGRRARAYDTVAEADQVRLPPFARRLAQNGNAPSPPAADMELPPLLAEHEDIWAFVKPAGLATQPGTGTSVNMADLLARHYASYAFKPAPAHRLDKETSGILLVGSTFAAQKRLQDWLREGQTRKEYLAWVKGEWLETQTVLLRHYVGGLDHIEAREHPFARASEAVCLARRVEMRDGNSLMQVLLVTGRKRQIRAQMAAVGSPVLGDSRYGGRRGAQLKLHACRVILPDGHEFACLPPWTGQFAVGELPPPLTMPDRQDIAINKSET